MDISIAKNCIIQLDLVVEDLTRNQSSNANSSEIYQTKYMVYRAFLQKIKKRHRQEGGLSQQIAEMEQILKERLHEEMQKIQKSQRIRGRPIKNSQAQKKLGEWIREQGRTQFTRKQIKDQLNLHLKKKIKCLPMTKLRRILQRCGIYNLEIQTKIIGKNQDHATIIHNNNELELKQEQSHHQQFQFESNINQQLFSDSRFAQHGDSNRYANRQQNQHEIELEDGAGHSNDAILSWHQHFSGDDSIIRFISDDFPQEKVINVSANNNYNCKQHNNNSIENHNHSHWHNLDEPQQGKNQYKQINQNMSKVGSQIQNKVLRRQI